MSRWNDVVQFLNSKETENSMSDVVVSYEPTNYAFANRKAVRQSEFYQAHALGLRPEKTFEVMAIDYNGEDFLRHDGKEYKVLRTYDKGEKIEIICEGVVNNATT